jgi:glycosyltransferase involved in cell wall biosynthesis
VLFPVDWPEPFSLVMIEAMACGTPVIAFNCGSVPEIIDEGVTGVIAEDIEEAIRAVWKAATLDRASENLSSAPHLSKRIGSGQLPRCATAAMNT